MLNAFALHCTTNVFFMFSNVKVRRLSAKTFLKLEKPLSTSTDVTGAYLKKDTSLGLKLCFIFSKV